MPEPTSDTALSDRELAVSRLIEGPQNLVYEAFTEVRHLAEWWGPNGFTTTTRSFDFRPGGVWEFTMHGPDGTDYPNWIRWIEIEPPRRMVLLHGETADDPKAFTSTITVEDTGEGTEVTIRTEFPTKEARDRAVEDYGAIEGGQQTLGRLADYVAKRKEDR